MLGPPAMIQMKLVGCLLVRLFGCLLVRLFGCQFGLVVSGGGGGVFHVFKVLGPFKK